jgi:hypothetical protein
MPLAMRMAIPTAAPATSGERGDWEAPGARTVILLPVEMLLPAAFATVRVTVNEPGAE